MQTKFVKPKAGLRVVKPGGGVLPAEGQNVRLDGPLGRYWRRRLKDGDVSEATPPKEK